MDNFLRGGYPVVLGEDAVAAELGPRGPGLSMVCKAGADEEGPVASADSCSSGLLLAVRQREAEAIRTALAQRGGRRGAAAARLGISERTLRYKLAALAGRPRHASPGAIADVDRLRLQ
jgi:DNA-binding NtrC family response regulator